MQRLKGGWLRFRLGGDIAIILATKLVALGTIKTALVLRSASSADARGRPSPKPSSRAVGKSCHYAGDDAILAEFATVSNAFGRLRKQHPAGKPGAGLRQTCSNGALA